ncbi:hypothetical protein B7463_g12316, partial [Scytalidium lignicola]
MFESAYLTVRFVVLQLSDQSDWKDAFFNDLQQALGLTFVGEDSWICHRLVPQLSTDSMHVGYTVTLEHRTKKKDDPENEMAIERLCNKILGRSAAAALNNLLKSGDLGLSPYINPDGTIENVDVTALQQQEKKNREDREIWIYRPICAAHTITQFFSFFSQLLIKIPPEMDVALSTVANQNDIGRIIAGARQICMWMSDAPRDYSQKLEKRLNEIDSSKIIGMDRAGQKFFNAEKDLATCIFDLGDRDPTDSEMGELIHNCSDVSKSLLPFHDATLDYAAWVESKATGCTVEAVIIGVTGGALAVGATIATGGLAGYLAIGACLSGAVTIPTAIKADQNWSRLKKTKEFLVAIKQAVNAIQTSRLFLWIIMVRSKAYMCLNTVEYKKFKKRVQDELSCDIDRIGQKHYLNFVVKQYYKQISCQAEDIRKDLETLKLRA